MKIYDPVCTELISSLVSTEMRCAIPVTKPKVVPSKQWQMTADIDSIYRMKVAVTNTIRLKCCLRIYLNFGMR